MPRTAVAYTNLVGNGSIDDTVAGTTVDATLVTNGVVIENAVPERTLIRVTHTHGTAHDVIVRAGDYPPALAAGQGDLTVEVAITNGARTLGPFESGRFIQNDGALHVDFEAGFTGTIKVLKLPKAV